MKKLLFVLFIFGFWIHTSALTTVFSKGGGALMHAVPGGTTGLKVTGTIDASDFSFMRTSLVLDSLDLSDCDIVALGGSPSNKIPDNAFAGYGSLIYFVSPNSATDIGNAAFIDCKKLDKIVLKENITNIDDQAFENCVNLRKIFCYSAIPPVVTPTSFNNVFSSCLVSVPKAYIPNYASASIVTIYGFGLVITNVENTSTANTYVKCIDKCIKINTNTTIQKAKIYSVTGSLIQELTVINGECTSKPLTHGSYLLNIGDETKKINI